MSATRCIPLTVLQVRYVVIDVTCEEVVAFEVVICALLHVRDVHVLCILSDLAMSSACGLADTAGTDADQMVDEGCALDLSSNSGQSQCQLCMLMVLRLCLL